MHWDQEREKVAKLGTTEYRLEEIQPRFGVRIPNSLAYPKSGRGLLFLKEMDQVVVSLARRNDENGWVVREGPFISWYPCTDWPSGTTAEEVCWCHIGRRLLYLDLESRMQIAPPIAQGPDDETLLAALEHDESDARGAPDGWGSLERCLGMATVLGRIACAVSARGDHPSDADALLALAAPVRRMLLSPDRCAELLWVDRFIECSLGLIAHAIDAKEGSDAAAEFIGHAAEAWQSGDCTAGLLEVSLSVGCTAISEMLVERLSDKDGSWQWPERVGPVLRSWYASGRLEDVDTYIRCQLRNIQTLGRVNFDEDGYDFEPLSTRLDVERAWQGWWDLHLSLFGTEESLNADFPRSILALIE